MVRSPVYIGIKQMASIESCLHLLEEKDFELAHDDMQVAYITITVDGKKMLFILQSKKFKVYFNHLFYLEYETTPEDKTIKALFKNLEGKALFDAELIEPDVRLIGDENAVEIDLCDDTYRVVRVTAEGFELTQPTNPSLGVKA